MTPNWWRSEFVFIAYHAFVLFVAIVCFVLLVFCFRLLRKIHNAFVVIAKAAKKGP